MPTNPPVVAAVVTPLTVLPVMLNVPGADVPNTPRNVADVAPLPTEPVTRLLLILIVAVLKVVIPLAVMPVIWPVVGELLIVTALLLRFDVVTVAAAGLATLYVFNIPPCWTIVVV